jgi:hypothetical protein
MENEKNIPEFQSIKSISNIVVISLILAISISGISMISSGMEITLLESLNNGVDFSDDELDANDLRVSTIASIYMIISFSSLILFYIWFYKAYKNLPALGGKELRFSARWVVLRFFIPILWFYQPYQATREIWKVSDPQTQESDKNTRKQISTSGLIKAWWALWIITGMIGWFYLRAMTAMLSVDTIGGFIVLDYMDIFTEIPMIVSSVLTLLLVKKISFNQEKKSQSFIQ